MNLKSLFLNKIPMLPLHVEKGIQLFNRHGKWVNVMEM